MNRIFIALTFVLFSEGTSAQPQAPAKSKYIPSDLFAASSFLPAGNSYRSATGEPGPAYWQNRADYKIDVSLDDKTEIITGTETITYSNNSPNTLSFLWIQMDQNVYKKHSKGLDSKLFLTSNTQDSKYGEGFAIESVAVKNGKGTLSDTRYTIYDTRMKIELAEPLPAGQQLSFQIKYNYKFPRNFKNADFNVNRTDILPTKNGDIYSVAQWYPRLCVLDDVSGWNTLPYLGNGEFYLEYGNFDVNITLPSVYIVEASGDLMNPEEVLTPAQLERWNKAKTSDKKVYIRTVEEVTDPASRPSKPFCTWKFKLTSARDFAWTASKAFVWEGIGIALPGGKKVLGSSLYPAESKLTESWERSGEYIKFTLQYFSQQWYEYPYNKAVNVASNLDGMEYPGLVFCAAKDKGNMYWAVVNHELGHTWFPMIVGSNERRYAWMDEGLNTFIDNIATRDFNSGEFKGYPEIDIATAGLFADSLPSIMTRPDVMPGNEVYTVQYQKVAYVLSLLREHILSKEQFDFALRKYIRDWAYKHPTPWDFFSSINNSTGEDLNWFWKSMFLENYKLDQKIANVTNPVKGQSAKAQIVIENMEKAAMPLLIEITFENGSKEFHNLPVEIWEQGYSYTFTPDSNGAITKVAIDPKGIFPDIAIANNVWSSK
ncbi:MAG TPA: M1 family metallopeptidase [Ohtaekwangia sp.]|uniref:M1 family metallopeptidase n=1 Tax=Ohtaekwangia sp. TaxID=2066019 RepID=UPI002F944B06